MALFRAAGGRCSECGVRLEPGWHADHIQPFSAGGVTRLINGRALCPACNLRKGGKMPKVGPWPSHIVPRDWQQAFFAAFQRADLLDFLLSATPGAGKTIAVALVARDLILRGAIEQIIVVVPTESLKLQWCEALASVGIQLNPAFVNRDSTFVRSSYHGIVVTYAAVAKYPGVYAALCAEARTLGVMDEIHHAGEDRQWGDGLRDAFASAVYRLATTGTAFRTDGRGIPFVSYHQDPQTNEPRLVSIADFKYTYRDALAAGIVRQVVFHTYEGQLTWVKDNKVVRAAFRDELSEKEASDRLRAAHHSPWLEQVLVAADHKLSDARRDQLHDAGGLVTAIDIRHARKVAGLLRRITGEDPVLITSDDPFAGEKLEGFRAGAQRWLVSVRMVSEGVDIPRLCVGVYATTIVTELFFRQFIGRFMRGKGAGYVIIPSEKTLMSYALRVEDEINAALSPSAPTDGDDDGDRGGEGGDERRQSTFRSLDGQAKDDGRVFQGEFAEAGEWDRWARYVYRRYGLTDPKEIALAIRLGRDRGWSPDDEEAASASSDLTATEPEPAARPKTTFKTLTDLRDKRTWLVSQLAGAIYDRGPWPSIGDVCAAINTRLKMEIGVAPKFSTEEQLERGNDLIIEWQDTFYRRRAAGTDGEWLASEFGPGSQRGTGRSSAARDAQRAFWADHDPVADRRDGSG